MARTPPTYALAMAALASCAAAHAGPTCSMNTLPGCSIPTKAYSWANTSDANGW